MDFMNPLVNTFLALFRKVLASEKFLRHLKVKIHTYGCNNKAYLHHYFNHGVCLSICASVHPSPNFFFA